MSLQSIWVDEYQPKNLDDYVWQRESDKEQFQSFIDNNYIPHLLLEGTHGAGKTTLAELLINNLDVDIDNDVKVINASDNNNVDYVRETLGNFVSTYAMGEFKIVFLDEADFLSLPAQSVLRRMIEENADRVRWIISCNYKHKLMPQIISRCEQYNFKAPDKQYVTERLATILIDKKVKFDLSVLDDFVEMTSPDIRQTIIQVEKHSRTGVLVPPTHNVDTADYKQSLVPLIETDNWLAMRDTLCSTVSSDKWEEVFKFLYKNLHTSPKFKDMIKWQMGIVTIADYMYKHSFVSDPEINAAALILSLNQL